MNWAGPHQSWWARFDSWAGHTDGLKNGTCKLSILMLGVNGFGARESFEDSAAIALPVIQKLLQK